jgi:NAD(P)-dependent dehydrogenase (short-subunit alcohol dehydrogenase family)
VALRLAAEGAQVVVHYRQSRAEAEAVAGQISAGGRQASCIAADLARPAEIKNLFGAAEKRFGRLDILVNSAAAFFPTPLAETTEEQWVQVIDSNLKSQFFCVQAAAPLLAASGRGRIINFASLGGLVAWPRYTAYCASKAGVIMLTRCLARALAPRVTVNAIAPGTISFPGDAPELAEEFIRKAPLKRTGTPADITEAVMYLAHASFVTGQVLVVDGGRSIPA